VLPVMFVENTGLVAAMGRSWQLVQGRWWRTFFILLLVFVMNYVVSLALGAFLYLGQILLSIFISPFLSLAIYQAGVIAVSGLTIPILQIAIVLIYFDLRVRREGLDLFQLAQRVAALPAARLLALLGALDHPAAAGDPAAAQSKLDQVLAMHRYDALHRPPSALDRLGQWINDRIKDFLRFLFGGNGIGGVVPTWVVYGIGILVIALVG